jgi:hypothetical protein
MKENFISSGLPATRSTLKTLAINAYASQDIDQFRTERFCASSTFLSDFQNKWNLSLRKPHPERRVDVDQEYVKSFLERLESCKESYPPERVLNFDETNWKLIYEPSKILAEKGVETVKLMLNRSEKQSFTAFGAISAA